MFQVELKWFLFYKTIQIHSAKWHHLSLKKIQRSLLFAKNCYVKRHSHLRQDRCCHLVSDGVVCRLQYLPGCSTFSSFKLSVYLHSVLSQRIEYASFLRDKCCNLAECLEWFFFSFLKINQNKKALFWILWNFNWLLKLKSFAPHPLPNSLAHSFICPFVSFFLRYP